MSCLVGCRRICPCRCELSCLWTAWARNATCFVTQVLTSCNRIHGAFEDMGDVPELYVAITAEDSSIVYYKLSKGLVKPQL